ncbi:MAG TPA: DoxX family protein [bacterium]|nr:DoxX family protein [bacterium]
MISTIRNVVLNIASKLNWLSPLVARIAVGVVFMQTGWAKLHNLPQIVEFFRKLGIPYPELQAPFVSSVELVCGILILVGLFTRLAAIPLIGTMVVAIITAKASQITGIADLLGFVEFLYIAIFLWLFTAGPGPVSIDHFICEKKDKES